MTTKAILLLLGIVLHQVFSQGGMFEELFTLDCNMIAHILPNTPIAANIDVAAFGSSYNFFTDKLKTRLKSCKCPNVSDRFFNRLPAVGSLEGLLHQFDESSKYDDSCSLVTPAKPGFYYSPPSTCTLENVSNGSPCNIKAFLPTANVTLQLSIDKCPTVDIENRVPYISMTCIGSGCKTFGRPCAVAADCGSIAFDCHNIGQAGFSFSHPIMDRVLDIIGITTNGTCANTANIYSTFMRDYLSSFYGMVGLGHAPSFCLPKSMTADATDLGISSVPLPQPSTTIAPQPPGTLYCGGIAATDRRVCGGYGSCVPTTNDTSVGYCKCYPSYLGGNTCRDAAVCNGISYSASNVCNGKGKCEFTSKYGTARCLCNSFSQQMGDNCDQPLSCYGILATNSSVCNRQGYCSSNYNTGEPECTCYTNWGGQQCNERIMCNGVWSNETNVCSGNGSCRQTTDSQGKQTNVCECRSGWGGANCDQVVTCNGLRFDDKNVCNGQGNCVWSSYSLAGACSCNVNYTGNLCEIPRSCGGILATDRLNVCSGVGTCTQTTYNGPYSCSCPRGRYGANCENIANCNGLPYTDRNVCSGNGTCNNDGTCSCYARYGGANCDVIDAIKCNGISELDRNVCSGRGYCSPNVFTRFQPTGLKSGKCNCYSPYQGNNCEKQPDCSINGCVNGRCNAYGAMEPGTGFCECQGLFWGKDCSQPITCSQPCQNGGSCVSGPNGDANGMCSCAYGYYGPQCQYTVKCKGIAYDDYPNVCSGDGSCSISTYALFATTEVTESGKCNCRYKMGKYCEKEALTMGSRVTIDAITAWDGILADGTSVTSDDRKTGKVFKITMPSSVQRDAKFVTLLRTYCNGEISVLPESVIGIRTIMPRVNGLLQALYNTLSMSRSCTSGYNNDVQRVLLQLWNLDPWLFMNTNPASTSTSIAQYAAYTSKYVMDMIGMGKPMIKMPTTCSYDTWKTTGKCTISFTALSKLMTIPIKLHLRVERCVSQEAKEGLPLIEFLCEGEICQSLRQLKPCNSDNDCSGTQCVDYYTQTNVPNTTFVDFWDIALNSYNMSDTTCRPTPETTWSDTWSMINYVQGTSYVSTGSSFKFCAYDGRGLYNSGAISQWTANIVTAQADSLQFDGLTDFSGPGLLNPDGNPTSLTTTAAMTTTAGPATTTVGPTGLPGDQTKSNSLAIGLGVGLGVGIPLVVVAVAGVIILGVVLKVKLGKRNDDYKQFGAEMNPYVRE